MPDSVMKYDVNRDCYKALLDSKVSSYLAIEPRVWHNSLLVSFPKKLNPEYGFLYLSSGDNDHHDMHPQIKHLRDHTNTVVAQLRILTNGPLIDKNSGKIISEDHAIALSWKRYLQTQSESELIQLQLQELVSKVIDLIECSVRDLKGLRLKGLVISGQSKRAQLCWLSASKDKRIIGIIPMVYDLLNIRANMGHHFKIYGFWADALAPYYEHDIPSFIDSHEFTQLAKLIDPYFFREKLKIPKYIINAANDEYFLPDSSQHYYKSFQGEKGLRYLPNHGHRLEDQGMNYWQDVNAAFQLMLRGIKFPEIQWQMKDDELSISYQGEPFDAYLWQATANQRDFRFGPAYPQFTSRKICNLEGGNLSIRPQKMLGKWEAFFVEFIYYFTECQIKLSTTTDIFILNHQELL
ncbi:MAG: PhoPQ-activated protein PqaA family protein [Oligoflexales bacterium]